MQSATSSGTPAALSTSQHNSSQNCSRVLFAPCLPQKIGKISVAAGKGCPVRALSGGPGYSGGIRSLTIQCLLYVYGRTSGFQRPRSEVSFQSFDIGSSTFSTS